MAQGVAGLRFSISVIEKWLVTMRSAAGIGLVALIIANCRTDEYEEMYRWLYKNVELFSDNEDKQDEAVVVIRNGIVKHTQVADVEINLSATLVELNNL